MEQKPDNLWKARPMRNGDEQAIFDLYQVAVHRHIEAHEWEWIFRNGPAGPAYVYVADNDGIMAGQHAVLRTNLQIHGKRMRGGQAFNTMTHPDYQKQGIFTALANGIHAQTASEGMHVIYAFPNENSLPGFIKYLGFFVFELPIMRRPLRAPDMLRRKFGSGRLCSLAGAPAQTGFNLLFPLRPKRDSALEILETSSFPSAESDDLFRRLSSKFSNMVVRDAKFLKWRYEDNPRFKYNIFLARRGESLDGYCVTRCIDYREQHGLKICQVIDIFTDPADAPAVSGLLSRALNEAAKTAAVAYCMLQPESPFMPYLKRFGFIFTEKKAPYILRVNTDAVNRSMIENVRHWHITFGDADFT